MFLSTLKNRGFKPLRKAAWDRRLVRFPASPDGKRLLHIGCGDIDSPEFINLDARRMPHVHIVSRNIFRLRMIPDAALDLIYMSHVLEHVPRGHARSNRGERTEKSARPAAPCSVTTTAWTDSSSRAGSRSGPAGG